VDLYRDAQALPRTLRGRNLLAGPADLEAGGLSPSATKWRARRGRMTRAHRGVYLVGATLPDLLDRVRAALHVAPPTAVVGFQTAAALLGFGVVEDPRIHLVVPCGGPVPHLTGIVSHESTLTLDKPEVVLGVPCTPAARCALDLARALPRADALSTLDAALAAGACVPDDLASELAVHDRLRGIRQARDLVPLADPRPQCRQESHLRLILHDGGVTELVPQHRVTDDENAVTYFLDLADVRRRIGIEYDGSSHLDRNRLRADRERHNWLESHGWRMRYFTDRDLYRRPEYVLRTVRAARTRSR
jgi:very-short-patch-repair endonuclease